MSTKSHIENNDIEDLKDDLKDDMKDDLQEENKNISISNNNLIAFKTLSNFIIELGEMFSSKQRSLKLYCRLINKTKFTHDKSIQKHIDSFRNFCLVNRDAILNKKIEQLTLRRINYSDRVYIDIVDIFKLADNETKNVIWEHLLCISGILDPTGKVKEIIKENLQNGKLGEKESNFLTEIVNKVESNIDPNITNPMEAVSSIMKSGVLNDVLSGLNSGLGNGDIDISKLLSGFSNMMGQMNGGDGTQVNPMEMISSMMGGGGGGGEGLNQLMSQMMSGLNKTNTITE